jgi:hypothetical protein
MHNAKWKIVNVGGLWNHNSRNGNVEHSNEDIDKEKTELNYNLAVHQELNDYQFVKKRLSEVKNNGRKNLNVLSTWAVTLPQTIPHEQEQEFFKIAYEFLEERYGKENIASAHVHLDESQPHMHFAFTPVRVEEDGTKKFNYDKLITRTELKKCQVELDKIITAEFDLEIGEGILNGATAGGNKSVAEMKTEKAQKQLEIVHREIETLKDHKNVVGRDVLSLERKINAQKLDLEFLEDELDATRLMQYPEKLDEHIQSSGLFKDVKKIGDAIKNSPDFYETLGKPMKLLLEYWDRVTDFKSLFKTVGRVMDKTYKDEVMNHRSNRERDR